MVWLSDLTPKQNLCSEDFWEQLGNAQSRAQEKTQAFFSSLILLKNHSKYEIEILIFRLQEDFLQFSDWFFYFNLPMQFPSFDLC